MSLLVVFEQVECDLFPEMRDSSLVLRTVSPDEDLVKVVIEEAMGVFKSNVVGPHKWVVWNVFVWLLPWWRHNHEPCCQTWKMSVVKLGMQLFNWKMKKEIIQGRGS